MDELDKIISDTIVSFNAYLYNYETKVYKLHILDKKYIEINKRRMNINNIYYISMDEIGIKLYDVNIDKIISQMKLIKINNGHFEGNRILFFFILKKIEIIF